MPTRSASLKNSSPYQYPACIRTVAVLTASTRIVLSQKCQYPYRPLHETACIRTIVVLTASTHIILARTQWYLTKYQYRHWNVQVAFCQYGHGRIKDRMRTEHYQKTGIRISSPIPTQARFAFGYLHMYVDSAIFSRRVERGFFTLPAICEILKLF